MLTRLIVNLYAWIIEIYLWFMLLISSVYGYYNAAPIFRATGLILENNVMGKLVGALIFAAVTFLVSAVIMGPIVALLDIRKSVRAFETNNNANSSRVLPAERREPF
jgi:hypothetical protein